MGQRISAGLVVAIGAIAFVASACGKPPEAPGGNADQAAEGAPLFLAHCAKCHGAAGEGTDKAPRLVGKDALPLEPRATAKVRKTQFRTAKDVLDFIRVNMPRDAPGSLSDTQYADILAFALKANGVDLQGKRVNEHTAGDFVLHAQ